MTGMADRLKLVVMSDLHIVPEGEVSTTLDTAGRLAAAVVGVNRDHADAALCIIAGDLANRGQAENFGRHRALRR